MDARFPVWSISRARALALAAAAPLAFTPRVARAQSATIRIGASSADSYAQAHFAQDGGFFTKYGLNASVIDFPDIVSKRLVVVVIGQCSLFVAKHAAWNTRESHAQLHILEPDAGE